MVVVLIFYLSGKATEFMSMSILYLIYCDRCLVCVCVYVILMKESHTCIASDFLHPLSYIGCCYFLCPEVRKQFESYSLFHHLAMQNLLNLFICLYLKCIQFEFTQSSLVACCTVTCAGFSSAIPNLRKLKTVTINSEYTLNMPKMIKYHFH